MISEMLVDWLKHAFISKFNHIRPSVYERYTDVLCRDLSSGSAVGRRGARKVRCMGDRIIMVQIFSNILLQHTYVDQSPLVARRLGFASLPLAVLAIIIGSQSVNLLIAMHTDDSMPWTWSLQELSNDDLINIAKWVALGVLFWLW